MSFVPTHTINGVPVAKVRRPLEPNKRTNYIPLFLTEEGVPLYPGRGRKATPLSAEVVVEKAAEAVREEQKQSAEETALIDRQTVRAILQAATWPAEDCPIGYAETVRGNSVTLDGRTEEGNPIAKVCIPGREGGNFVWVEIPKNFEFKLVK